jgi:hypothetical protein
MPSPMIVVLILALKLPTDASSTTRNASSSHRGDVNCVLPFSIPLKTYGAPSFPTTPPPTRSRSRLDKALIQVTSPPLLAIYSHIEISREAIWVMSTSKATDEEGFQAEFFKHGLHALDYHLATCLTMLFVQVFHRLGHTTLFTRSINRAPVQIQTTIERSWWATPSPSSMLQSFI